MFAGSLLLPLVVEDLTLECSLVVLSWEKAIGMVVTAPFVVDVMAKKKKELNE